MRELHVRRIGNKIAFVDSRVSIDLTGTGYSANFSLEGGQFVSNKPNEIPEFISIETNIGTVGELANLVDLPPDTPRITGKVTWSDPEQVAKGLSKADAALETAAIDFEVPGDNTQPTTQPRPSGLPSQEAIDELIRTGIIGSQK